MFLSKPEVLSSICMEKNAKCLSWAGGRSESVEPPIVPWTSGSLEPNYLNGKIADTEIHLKRLYSNSQMGKCSNTLTAYSQIDKYSDVQILKYSILNCLYPNSQIAYT